MVSKGRNNDQKEPDHQKKKPVKEHKKETEGIKYKQHEEMNDSSLKNEDAKQPESSPAPKVEEKEAKFKDTHIPNAFISETRSEGGIEDQHKLDQLSGKEDPQIFEETKSKRSNDKRNKNKHKKRKQWGKKQNQDSKGENKQNKQSKNS